MKENFEVKTKRSGKLFYILAILLVIYMLFSAITGYFDFINYCHTYELEALEEWFTGFRSIVAAVVPCAVYAALLYGMGVLIENK